MFESDPPEVVRLEEIEPQDIALAIEVLIELHHTGRADPGRLRGVGLLCMSMAQQMRHAMTLN